jgi:hypothetical protein
MFHEELAELLVFGDEEVDGFVQGSRGEIDGADEVISRGGYLKVKLLAVQGESLELPCLAAVEGAEAFGVDALFFEIDGAGEAEVLLDPGVFDGFGVDAEELFGQVAEGALGGTLDVDDVIDLFGGQDALFDQ